MPGGTLRDQLFERRIVVAGGWTDEVGVSDIAAQLLALDALGDDDITLRLDSFGCSVDAALTLMDAIDVVGVEIHAVAAGRLSGGAVGVLAMCDRRSVTPHLVVELREPDHRFGLGDGHGGRMRPEDLAAAAEMAADRLRLLCRRAAPTPDAATRLEAAFGRRLVVDSDELLRAGLADDVLRPTLGFR